MLMVLPKAKDNVSPNTDRLVISNITRYFRFYDNIFNKKNDLFIYLKQSLNEKA